MSDLDDCFRWASDPEVMKHTAQRTYTYEQEKDWLESVLKDSNEEIYVIVIKKNKKSIGTCAIHHKSIQHPEELGVSVGIMIGEKDEWGKGYGSDAIRTLTQYAHNTYAQKRVWLTVDTDHSPAIRAYEKAGFSIYKTLPNSNRKATVNEHIMEKIF